MPTAVMTLAQRRPRHSLNDRTLTTQVSQTQADHLNDLARIHGLSISAYIRQVLESHTPPPLPDDEQLC
jgi:hypothetical protein